MSHQSTLDILKIYLILGLLLLSNLLLIGQQPNIVWLVSEDNSKHFLELYDTGGAKMPHIEDLAKNGVVFNNAFSNAPVCSVARSTIISGCYAPRVGTQYHRRMELAPLPDGLEMFPSYLRKAGYYTTNNSKQDYNFITPEDTWDESSGKATYKNRKPGQPFFHVQNYGTTHEGKLHFSEEFMTSNPTRNALDTPLFPIYPDTETFRYTNAYYRDLHEKMDQKMGELIEELRKEGLLENTIIFYYGDHGGALPASKGYIYERGLHVPMVVYIPEKWQNLIPFERGSRTDVFVAFVDLAPTILNLANVEIPDQIDGLPFLGENIDLENKNTAFGYGDRFDEKYDLVRSMRSGKYKYIRNYQPFNIDGLFNYYRYKMLAYQEWSKLNKEGQLNEIQAQFFNPKDPEALYDIETDPFETINLASDPTYQKELIDIRKKLKGQVTSMPDLSFYPEHYFLENIIGNPVAFGQQNKERISRLIEIADLQLLTFNKAKNKIVESLNSNDPWERYWGLIVCSSFKNEAQSFYDKAREIYHTDSENTVKIRALEFLILNGQKVDPESIVEILKDSKSETEANLMLNTIALLKLSVADFNIHLSKSMFPKEWTDEANDLVNRRIDYLNE